MAIERWYPFRVDRGDPFRDLLDIHAHMNRVIDDFLGSRTRRDAAIERGWVPAIDIRETKDELVVAAELPGLQEKDIHLSIVDNVLSLRGQRRPLEEVSEEDYHRIERWTGTFERHVQLPVPVQADKVRATYREGVLEVRLPKVEESKPREIRIEVS